MRHCKGTEKKFEEVARLHEMVGILIGKICVCVMQLMCLTKICERDHAGYQRDASPPEVCGFGSAEMPVHALVSHDRTQKDQIGAEQNVADDEKGIGNRNEECPDGECSHNTDDRAAEVVDFSSGLHVKTLDKGECFDCGRVAVS